MFSGTSASCGLDSPEVYGFYRKDTGSIQYLVCDPRSNQAAMIDVVLDIDPDRDFDYLFDDDEPVTSSSLSVSALWSPGNTSALVSYLVGGAAAFVHDTFMQVDVGTVLADFQGGSADELFVTLQTNMRGGRLPEAESDGHRYLKIPLNRFTKGDTP